MHKISRNLKPEIPSTKFQLIEQCSEATEEIQRDFGSAIYDERNQEKFSLACIDDFSKFPSAEVYEHANANCIQKVLQINVLLQCVLRRIRFDRDRVQVGK